MTQLVNLFLTAALAAGTAVPAIAQTSPQPPTLGAPGEKPAPSAEKAGVRSVLGKVKSASADTLVVAGKSRGKDAEWTFTLDPKARIKKDGKNASTADIKEGDAVAVRFTERDGKNVAQAVMARTDAAKTDAPTEKKP